VGLFVRYRRVSFSRKGVEGLQRVFPDDKASAQTTLTCGFIYPVEIIFPNAHFSVENQYKRSSDEPT
jgi:hypothetical protein